MTWFLDDLQKEFHSAMLQENLHISNLMVHSKHVEEARDRRKSIHAKREKSYDGGYSKNSFHIQQEPIFKKWISSQFPSKLPKTSVNRVSNPMLKYREANLWKVWQEAVW